MLSFPQHRSHALFLHSLPLKLPLHSISTPTVDMSTARETTSGPFNVSTVDLRLIPSPSPRARLFYPCGPPTRLTPALWFPPSLANPDETVEAILSYARLPFPKSIATLLSPIAQQSIPACKGGAVVEGAFPIVLFSHGLGGSIGGYCNVCCEMASHGFIVIAPEHTDGSAFVTFVGEERRRVEYIHYNAVVHGEGFRIQQLETRCADLRACLEGVRECNRGNNGRFAGLTTRDEMPRLEGKVAGEIYLVGHSFGAATVLKMATEVVEGVKGVVCLDSWLVPLGKKRLGRMDVEADIVFVDMGMSSMGESVKLRGKLRRGGGIRDAVVVRGGMHNNSSDFPLRVPRVIARAMGLTARGSNPLMLLRLQSEAVIALLKGEWAQYRERVRRGDIEGMKLGDMGDARVLQS